MRLKGLEIIIIAVYCLSIVFLISTFSDANNFKKSKDEILQEKSVLKQLREGTISEKTNALQEINNWKSIYPLSTEIGAEILLLAEKKREGSDFVRRGEFGLSYDIELIYALGNTRDVRAIPYLMDDLSDPAAKEGFHKIGEPAIEPLIEKLHDKLDGYRSGAARALSLYLKPNEGYLAQGEIRKRKKEELIAELKNPRNNDPARSIKWYEIEAQGRAGVRENIIVALGYLAEEGDKEVIPIIKSTAEEDPYYLDMSKKTNYTGPQKRYMVREEAKKILVRLKTKGILK